MRRFLAREFPSVEMLEACDGEQAVAMAEAYTPDLILLDLRMPEMDGLQAATAIRALERGRDVPMLALSIDGSPGAEANVMRAGFKEFMLKPVSDYSALEGEDCLLASARRVGEAIWEPATPRRQCARLPSRISRREPG